MADDVQVTIGVALDQLVSGVDSAKGSLEELKSGFEGIIAALAVEKIASFVESMAQLGEQTERTAAILGVSTTSAQELGNIAKLTGGSSEQMAMSIERLQLGLQRGSVATSTQAKALDAMGLSAKSLIGLSVDAQMDKIADAVSKFADGGTKTAAVMALLGRGGAQMIPFLDEGAKGFDEWRQKMVDFGTIIDGQTTKSLSTLDKQIVLMKASWTALSAAIVGVSSAMIGNLVTGITQSIGSLNQMITTGQTSTVMFAYMESFIANLIAKLGYLAVALGDIFSGRWGATFTEDMTKAQAVIDATAISTKQKLDDVFNDLKTDYTSTLKEMGAVGGPQMPGLSLGKDTAARDALTAANEQIKLNQMVFDDTKTKLESNVKTMQMFEFQKTAILKDAITQRETADLEALNDAEKNMAVDSKEWTALQNKKLEVMLKADADMTKANDDQMQKMAASAKSFADQMSSAIGGQLKSLLSGTETFGEAMKNVFADMTIKIIEDLIKIALEALATRTALAFLNVFTGGAASGLAGVASALPIPFHAVGTDYVPQTGLAMLHEGEAVIPAESNPSGTGGAPGGGGGGGSLHLNVSAIDANSFASALMNNRSALAIVLRNLMRTNPSMLMQAATRY